MSVCENEGGREGGREGGTYVMTCASAMMSVC